MVIKSQWLAETCRPGQFIHVLPPGPTELLRRPFSILSANSGSGEITVLFRVMGEGTRLIASAKPGDELDILGPLGNGFPIDADHPAILVGGGVGIPPLVFLASKLSNALVFLGARDSGTLICLNDFKALGIEPVPATEDGSIGFKGLVTGALDQLESIDPDSIIYACGPIPMLAAVARWSSEKDLKCRVSLENKLGCGIGACLGCSIPIRTTGRTIHYERVCCDGPIFDASRVAFDLM